MPRQLLTPIPAPEKSSSGFELAASIGRNTAFGFAASAVQVATRLVMLPVVIHHIGLDGYGIWSIVMATVGYMRFGSAGLRSAFQKYVAQAHVDGGIDTASKLLSTGAFTMSLISLLALLPLALYSRTLAQLSGVPPRFLSDTQHAITLLALIMILANFGGVFEGILMGSHRLDLTRQFHILVTISEALAIILLLHLGYGLFAMAITMAASEVAYVVCCALAARRIEPRISVSVVNVTPAVLKELARYALTYQCVNILEVLYGVLLPVTILKYFGTDTAGVYAVASRLVTVAMMGADALILPLLTGGTMMLASATSQRKNTFLRTCFTLYVAITVFPLGFVAAFGTPIIKLWAGRADPQFGTTIYLLSFTGFFSAISRLQLIFYRASGAALHDNIRQVFRLSILLLLTILGRSSTFSGVLTFLAAAEVLGVAYMFFAMARTFVFFRPHSLMPDTLKLLLAATAVVSVAAATAFFPVPLGVGERTLALLNVAEGLGVFLVTSWPALVVTGVLSTDHMNMLSAMTLARGNTAMARPCWNGHDTPGKSV
ncbi:MAG: lipopolysaccharide biosynthesis protein [Bryobacterales bacterium]|nr:lipopolysaccharide biosynthesis protein [Bryobacterales bacterium]